MIVQYRTGKRNYIDGFDAFPDAHFHPLTLLFGRCSSVGKPSVDVTTSNLRDQIE